MTAAVYSISDVAKHTKRSDVLMIIHNDVYNVSTFLSDHPGGEEVLMDHAGTDASSSFDDIGHSEEAHELMKKYFVGTLDGKSAKADKKKTTTQTSNIKVQVHESSTNYAAFLVPIVAVLAYITFKWLQ